MESGEDANSLAHWHDPVQKVLVRKLQAPVDKPGRCGVLDNCTLMRQALCHKCIFGVQVMMQFNHSRYRVYHNTAIVMDHAIRGWAEAARRHGETPVRLQ